MDMIKLKINGTEVEVEKGASVLDASKKTGIKIPTLCYHPDLEATGACGLCIVKPEKGGKIFRACATPAEEGMSIITHDAEINSVRKTTLELILSNHPDDCLKCGRSGNCELQTLAADFGIREMPFDRNIPSIEPDTSTPSIVLNPEKCILCGRCAHVCQELQGVHALEFLDRGEFTRIAPAADVTLDESPCIKCGQCSAHCPVGAIFEKADCGEVWEALQDESKHVVVQVAPAVRVALGEAFGLEPGTILTGKIYTALRMLGFDAIFDTNFSADLTIMEEGTEFVKKFTEEPESLPLVTSCCPAWVDYLEKFASDMIPHFSTAKSPQQMLGAAAKTYYAKKAGIDPKDMFVVSIMPCTAKKFEVNRSDDMFSSGYQDVDLSITTRELARIIKSSGIDLLNLEESKADSILGEYSGAGTIFGVTGGVMEAALRTAYHLVTGDELEKVEFEETRGLEGVKEATIDWNGTKINIAVAHGMVNIEQVLDKIRAAKVAGEEPPYHFVEVMACRGGCIGGGGQPQGATDEIRKKRTAGIYTDDEKSVVRCSHLNPEIQAIYKEFLGEPNSKLAHKYLHTGYTPREVYAK